MLTFFLIDRLKLLVHITCKLGSYGITSDKLKQVARDIERKLPDPKRAEVIYEILRVRKMQERFEGGEVGKFSILTMIALHLTKTSQIKT